MAGRGSERSAMTGSEGGGGGRGGGGGGHQPAGRGYGAGMRRACGFLVLALAAAPALAFAQGAREKNAPVPKASLPPAGMCRIWLDNVPAARQPAPTDCPTAIRNKPPNARVIFPPRTAERPAPKGAPPARPDSARRRPPD